MDARVDDFVGSLEQYVSYLEQELLSTRRQNPLCTSPLLPSTTGPNAPRDSTYDPRDAISTQPREKRLKRSRELEFIMLDPETITLNPVKLYVPTPRWKDNANALIAETPKAVDWYKLLRKQGLYDISAMAVSSTPEPMELVKRLACTVVSVEYVVIAVADWVNMRWMNLYSSQERGDAQALFHVHVRMISEKPFLPTGRKCTSLWLSTTASGTIDSNLSNISKRPLTDSIS
ncbi:hypothetical protein Slin14017_G000780 [Septoria linicola]|nr:hypothetical protein Slin14017_G000780 [Septoria linicola]